MDIVYIGQSIKEKVQSILPGAEVFLFGSQVKGTATDESDWDVLILIQQEVTPAIKHQIHERLFPLSVELGRFINYLLVQESHWYNDAAYYSLRIAIDKEMKRA
jgi:uncharacterized protein